MCSAPKDQLSMNKTDSFLTELEYLREFYYRADFGPAHGDVMLHINEDIEATTSKKIPPAYKAEY